VFQGNYLLDHLSLLDNTIACGLLVSKDRRAVLKRAQALFEKVGLGESVWKKFPYQVSGGESQRAGVVRALINNPGILFADEPIGSLDSVSGRAVMDVLTSINQEGQCVVMVTHDSVSARRGSRVLYLRDGKIWGECVLGPYERNRPERVAQLDAFLAEMR
jgi:putative ABC transport system ATP-binding protein